MGYTYPRMQVEKIKWGFKVINGRPYLDDECSRLTDAITVFWDEANQIIIENGIA